MSDCSDSWSVGPDLARLPDWRIVPGEPGVMTVTFAEGELPPGEWTVTAGYNDLDLITGTAVADGDALTITFDAEASADLFDDGVLTVPWRLYLDGAWWGGGNIRPASLNDDPGPCGATVVLNPPDSDPITVVVSRCAEDGDDGREVELRVDGSTLQWRYVGDAAWTNLYDLGDVEVDGQGITVALALASAADLIATEDPLPFRDIDGDAQFPAPLDDIPVGTKVLARDEAPAEQGLWTWDGATWTYDADQPGGSPVFVLLPGPAGPGWFVVSPFDGPGAPYRQADTRRDREQLWTAAQTTRLAVPTDGSVVPFGNLEIVDPGDPDEGLSFGGVVVAGLDIPGLGPVVGGGVAVEQWNPFTQAFTGAAGVLVYSFVGVDNTFAPMFRFAIRQRAIGGSLLTSELAPLYVGEPVDPEDAATKRYVDDTLGDTLGNYVTDGDPRLSDARTPTAHTHDAGDITSGVLDIERIPELSLPPAPGAWAPREGGPYVLPADLNGWASGGAMDSGVIPEGETWFAWREPTGYPWPIKEVGLTVDGLGSTPSTYRMYLFLRDPEWGRPGEMLWASSTFQAVDSNTVHWAVLDDAIEIPATSAWAVGVQSVVGGDTTVKICPLRNDPTVPHAFVATNSLYVWAVPGETGELESNPDATIGFGRTPKLLVKIDGVW